MTTCEPLFVAAGMFVVVGAAPGLLHAEAPAKAKRLSDAQIKKVMIRESIDAYPGNCPCPYNTASNGSSCGGRSAWSRAGGAAPLCYASDITTEMVAEYRATNNES